MAGQSNMEYHRLLVDLLSGRTKEAVGSQKRGMSGGEMMNGILLNY
jgi:hypothetical protein